MSASQRTPATRDEVATLGRGAGLDLSPDHFDELVAAYAQLEPVLWRMRRNRDRADEPAHVFDPRRFMPRQEEGGP